MPRAATCGKSINSPAALCLSHAAVLLSSNHPTQNSSFGISQNHADKHQSAREGSSSAFSPLPWGARRHRRSAASPLPQNLSSPETCVFLFSITVHWRLYLSAFFFFFKDVISKSSLHRTTWGSNLQPRVPESPGTPLSSSKSYLFMGPWINLRKDLPFLSLRDVK